MAATRERQSHFLGGEVAPTLWGRTDLAHYASACRMVRNFLIMPHGGVATRSGTQYLATLGATKPRLLPIVLGDGHNVVLVVGQTYLEFYKVDPDPAKPPIGVPGLVITNAISNPYAEAVRAGLRHAQVGYLTTILSSSSLKDLRATGSTVPETAWTLTDVSFDVQSIPSTVGPARVSADFDMVGDDSHKPKEWQLAVTRVIEHTDGITYETLPQFVTMARQAGAAYDALHWSAATTYGAGDRVYYRGYTYTSVGSGNLNHPPPTGPTSDSNWNWASATTAAAWSAATTYSAGDRVSYVGLKFTSAQAGNLNHAPLGGTVSSAWWIYDGSCWDTGVSMDIAEKELRRSVPIAPDHTCKLQWDTSGFGYSDRRIIATRIYRGRAGRLGFGGETSADEFVDDGAVPNFSRPPPQGFNPFKVFVWNATYQTWDFDHVDYPRCIAYHEGRRVLAGSPGSPVTLRASAVEQHTNFDRVVPAQDSDALSVDLATKTPDAIHGVVGGSELLVLTEAGEWLLTGAGTDEVITPTSIAAHPLSYRGCAQIEPVAAGDTVFFVERSGTYPMAIVREPLGLRTRDVSENARHLFEGHKILDLAYSANPWNILWALRDDGVLLSMTWSADPPVTAWARHDLGALLPYSGGLGPSTSLPAVVESMAVIQEGGEDVLYLAVKRSNTRTLERMRSRLLTRVDDACHVDNAFLWNGENPNKSLSGWAPWTMRVSGAAYTPGSSCTIWMSSAFIDVSGDSPVGQVLEVDGAPGETPGRLTIVGYNPGGPSMAGTVDVTIPVVARDVATTAWRRIHGQSVTASHLGTAWVSGLRDGVPFGPVAASAGVLDAGAPFVKIAVGHSYVFEFESLDSVPERGKPRAVKALDLEYQGALSGGVGMSLSEGTLEARADTPAAGNDPRSAAILRLPVPAAWSQRGSVAVRQSQPLPLAILAITREVEVGG
jgi:hypothetical protein